MFSKFANYHGLNKIPEPIPKPLPSGDLKLYISDWDYEFITSLNED